MPELSLRGLGAYRQIRDLLGWGDAGDHRTRMLQIRSSKQLQEKRLHEMQMAERKYQRDTQMKLYTTMLTQLSTTFKELPEGPRKNHLIQMMENVYYRAPREIQIAMQGAAFLRPISPEEKRIRLFERMNKRPEWPRGADGNKLPWLPENELRIADSQLRLQRWMKRRNIAGFGGETGAAMTAGPTDIFMGPEETDPKTGATIPGSGKFFVPHPTTLAPMGISKKALGITEEQLKDWDWNWAMVAAEGGHPITAPFRGKLAGTQAEVTPIYDFLDNKIRYKQVLFGSDNPKRASKEIEEMFIAAKTGEKRAIRALNEPYRTVAELLSDEEFRRFSKKEDIDRINAMIADKLGPAAGDYRIFIDYDINEKGELVPAKPFKDRGALERAFEFDSSMYEFRDFPFTMSPVEGTVTLIDGKGQDGTFYRSRTKDNQPIALQGNGRPLAGSKGKTENDVVPEADIPAPRPVPEEIARPDVSEEAMRVSRETGRPFLEVREDIMARRFKRDIKATAKVVAEMSVGAIKATLEAAGMVAEVAEARARAYKRWQTETGRTNWDDFAMEGWPGWEEELLEMRRGR